jgi:Protein of unknown function (DUF3089)
MNRVQYYQKIIIRLEKFFSLTLIFFLSIIGVSKAQKYIIPDTFEARTSPKAPIYSDLKNWASHPQIKDQSDSIPKSLLKNKKSQTPISTEADVFYIYPTIYTQEIGPEKAWNAALDDSALNQKIDNGAILNQATVFNEVCAVYAPRYRQAHYSVFISADKVSCKKALDLAFEDVKVAFKYYIENENKGRPFFIAGHSQGTIHAVRLIKEVIEGTDLQAKMIEAYLVGMPINDLKFTNLKLSKTPEATGGYVSWNTFAEDFYPTYDTEGYKKSQVINPITWTDNTDWADKKMHKGMIGFKLKFDQKAVSAKIHDGVLWIKKPDVRGKAFIKLKIWHFADYNLFWLDIRENVALRLNSYLKNKQN